MGGASSVAPPTIGRGRGRPNESVGTSAAVVGVVSEPQAPPPSGDAVPEDGEGMYNCLH